MLESILAYINDQAWAQLAFVAFLFGPPMVAALHHSQRGLASLNTILGWFAFIIMLALLLV